MTLKDLMEGDDLDVFFNADEFGTEVTFTGVNGPEVITGIFEEESLPTNDFTGDASLREPVFRGKTSDLEKARPQDELRKGLVTYRILSITHEAHGVTTLGLAKKRDDS